MKMYFYIGCADREFRSHVSEVLPRIEFVNKLVRNANGSFGRLGESIGLLFESK